MGTALTMTFAKPSPLKGFRAIFDSDLNREGTGDCAGQAEMNSLSNYPLNAPPRKLPDVLLKGFRVEGVRAADGGIVVLAEESSNWHRHWTAPVPESERGTLFAAVRLVPCCNWGGTQQQHIFAFQAE